MTKSFISAHEEIRSSIKKTNVFIRKYRTSSYYTLSKNTKLSQWIHTKEVANRIKSNTCLFSNKYPLKQIHFHLFKQTLN